MRSYIMLPKSVVFLLPKFFIELDIKNTLSIQHKNIKQKPNKATEIQNIYRYLLWFAAKEREITSITRNYKFFLIFVD